MLTRTKASLPPAVAAAAGAPLTSAPVDALTNLLQGRHDHDRHSHRSHGRDRNPNRDRHRPRILIRIHEYNGNGNRARTVIARPCRREVRPGVPAGDTDPIAGDHPRAGTRAPARNAHAGSGTAGVAAGHPGSATVGTGATSCHLGDGAQG
ncbi:hypothetical protein GCM10023191_061600 [Actinoallomurus oryzae]|uniref:Secreted protein n=1 Tax=Actinoallomurus oryzae TaxID=502180 RepID=A0ABP8QLY4_9ACTN